MAKIISTPSRIKWDELKWQAFSVNFLRVIFGWGILAFLFGAGTILGELWPFGLSYLAAFRVAGNTRKATFLPALFAMGGITWKAGLTTAFPYYGVVALLLLASYTNRRSAKLWLICGCFLIKLPLHYLLEPVPMVFVIALTECVLAVFCYDFLEFAIVRYRQKQLAYFELLAVLVIVALIVALQLGLAGLSLRLFLIGFLIAVGARTGGLKVSCIAAPALAMLAFLLGEPVQLVYLLVSVGLLAGFLKRFRWGYLIAPLLAYVFTFPGSASAQTLPWLLVLAASFCCAQLVKESSVKLLARLLPESEEARQQMNSRVEQLKSALDGKIDQYLLVYEELQQTLADIENPLLYEQMHSMVEMLAVLKDSFSPQVQFGKDFEDQILNHFKTASFSNINVLKNGNGFEVSGQLQECCVTRRFCHDLAEFCSGTLESQRYKVAGRQCLQAGKCGFSIVPFPKYKVEIGRAKVARGEISGDNQLTFEISSSRVAILLSDGMGIGPKAARESDVAIRLLERMIKADYDLNTAVWLVNHLLRLRNPEEMFVTIDLVVIDLFTGSLEFVKIGSAPSFIKRGHEVEIIHNHALPVGVLNHVDVETDRRILKEGEVLVMATDGVLDAQRGIANKDEWMCWNLRRLQDPRDMAFLAEEILSDSLKQARGIVQDDMTVVVARLIRNGGDLDSYRRA